MCLCKRLRIKKEQNGPANRTDVSDVWWGSDYASSVKGFEKHQIILGGRHLDMTESENYYFKYDRVKVIIFGKGVARHLRAPE